MASIPRLPSTLGARPPLRYWLRAWWSAVNFIRGIIMIESASTRSSPSATSLHGPGFHPFHPRTTTSTSSLSLTLFLSLSAPVNSALKFSVNVKDQKTDVRYTSRARRRSISCNPQPVRVSVGISFTKILLDMEIVIVSWNFAWVCLSRRIFWSNFKPPRGCSSLRQKKIKEGHV